MHNEPNCADRIRAMDLIVALITEKKTSGIHHGFHIHCLHYAFPSNRAGATREEMAERKINPSQANRDAARGLRRMKMITDIVAHQNECSLQIYSSIVKVQNDTKKNISQSKKITNVINHLCQELFSPYLKKKV